MSDDNKPAKCSCKGGTTSPANNGTCSECRGEFVSPAPVKPREWTSVEIFNYVNTGDDIGKPESFVSLEAYTALQAECEHLDEMNVINQRELRFVYGQKKELMAEVARLAEIILIGEREHDDLKNRLLNMTAGRDNWEAACKEAQSKTERPKNERMLIAANDILRAEVEKLKALKRDIVHMLDTEISENINLKSQLAAMTSERDDYRQGGDAEARIVEEYIGKYKRAIEREAKLLEALEFYASSWRSDVYTGPSEELIKDFGERASNILKENAKAKEQE